MRSETDGVGGGVVKRTVPLRAFSKRRASQRAERSRVVAAVHERDAETCQAHRVDHRCAGPLDVHEVIPRSVWALGYLDVDNCVLVCRVAHQWIDGHPDDARLLGLHGKSWDRK